MAYPAYTNNNQYYMQSLEDMRNRIDNQIRQYQQNQMQMQQPQVQPITQNFSIAPTQNNTSELEAKYANNIDEVKNTFVIKTGIFLNKDYSTLWLKDVSGNIRTFKIEEIIEVDERDKEIMALKQQIEDMKEMIANERNANNSNIDEQFESKSTTKLSNRKQSNAK
jgi:hypothetical protein